MKVTFLGTGTSQGVPVVACNCKVCQSTDEKDKRLRTSALIEIDGSTILIDAGPDFRQQMLRENVKKLDAILVTHEHYDHIAGLDDIRAFNWIQKRPTDIYAELRVQKSIKKIFSYVFASKKYPGIPQMNLHDIENEIFQINGIEIIPIRGMHYKLPVLGFRFGSFAYLTDMKTINPIELEKLFGVEVLVVEALRKEAHISHMNLDEALDLIATVKPQKAYLTHVSHLLGLQEEVSKELPSNVSFAYDGLCLDL
ncbi:MAG: MBL fold metallo-hydrolase [Prolixibacteraceae bacterium]|jgi:phosphoribosyl 1,2-cyclic phosphate phosphodiesterase|nr:MBL fold metallo-hydrolase [Prolixibacteraceae bacterium]